MAKNYDGMAVGAFELDNLVACFVALDAASKAANVTIQSVERNRLKSGACVKIRGSVSDVNAAMEVALELSLIHILLKILHCIKNTVGEYLQKGGKGNEGNLSTNSRRSSGLRGKHRIRAYQ